MTKRLLSLFGMALALSGCAVGPDYQRPEAQLPANWRTPAPADQSVATVEWWSQFGDPILEELIREALLANRDVLIATARVDEYAARLGIVQSQYFPMVGAQASGEKRSAALANGSQGSGVGSPYAAFAAASWEIDLWGKIRRQNEAARAQYLATQEARTGVMLTLASSVANSYINLLRLDQQLAIAEATARSRGESYEIFKDRYQYGIISQLTLSQNKSQYEEALATIPVLRKAISIQENALSILLGRNPGPITRGKTLVQLRVPAVPVGLPSSLLERRPDILAAEQQLVAANARIGVAKAAYFPTLSLTGLAGIASPDLSKLVNNPSNIWQYGASLTMPIFTAGKIAGEVKASEAEQQQALQNYLKTIQNGLREVNDALVDQQQTSEQLQVQARQVKALQEYYDVARLRWDNGYSNYLDVLDAERSLFNAQMSYATTEQTLLQSAIAIYSAMGGGWQPAVMQLTPASPVTNQP